MNITGPSAPAKPSKPMGTGKDRIPANYKSTILPQEMPTAPSQSGWQTFTPPFYGAGTPSPPLFIPFIASTSTPIPMFSGNQHPLMQSYGNPLQYPAVYHHGELYPHLNVVAGPILPNHEEEGNMITCGDMGSITNGGRSSENTGFLDGKSGDKENAAPVSGKNNSSKSAANGRKDSFDASEHPLMQSYWSSLQYPAVYYHGELYPHPNVVAGPILGNHEEEGKMITGGDMGSITTGGRSSENTGFLDGKSGDKENAAAVSGKKNSSKSAANGRKDSFDASDDIITHDFFPTKKRSYDKLIADNSQNRSTSQHSDGNSVSAVEDPVVSNPKIDLTLRMSLDTACSESVPSKVRLIETDSGVTPSVASAMKVKINKRMQDELVKKIRRCLTIKEAVRRLLIRRQEEYENLQAAGEEFKRKASSLLKGLTRLSVECMKQNCQLKSLMEEKTNTFVPDAKCDLVAKDPKSVLQPVSEESTDDNEQATSREIN